ncbi:MAG: sigma-54 dependent transcriptional regulator [Ignavibacteria bacterium]|nr:sigma-54 dependent transcriptional regulator [Ignavibacteria bacterium]
MKKILIIDDEFEMLESLKKIISFKPEFDLTLVQEPLMGIELVQKNKFDLIISDLKMNDVSGIEILNTVRKIHPETPVIIISGYGTIEASVEAMKLGAFDFLEKPFTSKKLFESIDRALTPKPGNRADTDPTKKAKAFEGIIFKSQRMEEVIRIIERMATTNMNVLITGESGTGKELVARAIHKLSKSSSDPFIPVNCGALPENLFESELFGHERGAFTGAVKTKPGLLEFASHGTFFFDEIGELSQTLQVKLLRMLEEKKIRRVGGQEEIEIDVRIIAATNKDLKRAVDNNSFREDLYYRLSSFVIEVPPLRERIEDIIPLSIHFMREICERKDEIEKKFNAEAENAFKTYSWPGNIRELQNVIGRISVLCTGATIEIKDLPVPIKENSGKFDKELFLLNYINAKESIIEKFEVEYLTHHLKKNQGNISKTAQECGLDRRTLHRLIKKYSIIYKE